MKILKKYTRVLFFFEVPHYEFELKNTKFKMADPISRIKLESSSVVGFAYNCLAF